VRLAVVSDIHANLTALEAVTVDLRTISPDLVIHGGDLVGSGAHPAEVVDRIRELGWAGVYGNADEMVWNPARVSEIFAASALQHWRDIVLRTASWTRAALGDKRIEWLRALPPRMTEQDISVVHARPDDCWRSPDAEASDEELLTTYATLKSRVVIYGHIHRPYVRRLPSIVVVNSGSVSLSYDGDPRAAYAVVDGEEITIRRVEYNVEREARALVVSDCPDAQWIAAMLRTGTPLPPPRLLRDLRG
jgi:putative phosphoesterase